MKRQKITVALLFGGRSAEHEVSLSSAAAIYKNIDRRRFRVLSIFINRRGEWKKVASPLLPAKQLNKGLSFSFLPWLGKKGASFSADIYFPVLHGPYGEDGTIQGLLEMADVPYVGSGVTASAIGMDKAVMKEIFARRNLPIVPYLAFTDSEWEKDNESVLVRLEKEFSFPLFVKPANLGSSIGISKVKCAAEISLALRRAFCYDRKVLVEQGIIGREIECSVLGNENPRASLPGEVIPYRDFYDYRDKYLEGKTRFRIPADLPPAKIAEVQRLAVQAYRAVDCSGMARLDFFIEDRTDRLYLNEVNTIPGFTEISMYPKLWEVSGLTFSRLVEELIRLGFERHRRKKRCLERRGR